MQGHAKPQLHLVTWLHTCTLTPWLQLQLRKASIHPPQLRAFLGLGLGMVTGIQFFYLITLRPFATHSQVTDSHRLHLVT